MAGSEPRARTVNALARAFFTSDLHLGDEWAAKKRYGSQPAAALINERAIREDWDANVRDGDQVFILGDLSSTWDTDHVYAWIADRPGTKHLVLGNWDDDVRAHDEAKRVTLPFMSINDSLATDLFGQGAWMSHYPYGNPSAPPDIGRLLLHGHTHSRDRLRLSRAGTPMVNVAWDAWKRIVPALKVLDTLEALRPDAVVTDDQRLSEPR
jgi:calcineurin-like phosphoesterase family protein